MKPQQYAITYERLRGEATWKLLSADHAPEVLALLHGLLFQTQRSLPTSVLQRRLANELAEFRAAGHDLKGSPAQYLGQWLNEGWLERRYPEGAGEEEYELSVAAQQALRVVGGLQSARPVATESRLALVIDQLAQLSRATDADPNSRLEQLYEDRKRIDAQIEAVALGQVDVLEPERAFERLREIVALAVDLTEDFRRVRDDFSQLNHEFRKQVESEGLRGAVLEDLFAGVDLIAATPAGRTFSAFWRLLTDQEQRAQLENAIDAITKREFASQLDREERVFLGHLTRTLLDRAGAVNNTRTRFARNLRSYVQSREYQEQRRLGKLLRGAKAEALALIETLRPEQAIGQDIRLSTATFRSLGRWKLHDPGLPLAPATLTAAAPADVTLDEVAAQIAEADIDVRSLLAQVREMLATQSQCSIGALLERYPAAQGLGSVVGFVHLGMRFGELTTEHRERVHWTTASGEARSAAIPLIYFLRERVHELG